MAVENSVELELTFTLPASLAREAESYGLLTPAMVAMILRGDVQRRRIEQGFEAANRLAALSLSPLTEAEVEAEIREAREERQSTRAGCR